MPNASWLASFGTPDRPRTVDGHALWPGRGGWSIATVRAPRRIAYVLVCTKQQPLDWLWAAGPPNGVAAVHSLYPADPRLAPLMRALCPSRTPAVFIGDLDPVGVAQYLAAKGLLRSRHAPALAYGGMDDAWLQAIGRALRRGFTMESLRIRLDKDEARLWRQLDDAIDVERLVGPEACRLMRSGYKLELEAASNPALLKPSHRKWVFRHLRAMAMRDAD